MCDSSLTLSRSSWSPKSICMRCSKRGIPKEVNVREVHRGGCPMGSIVICSRVVLAWTDFPSRAAPPTQCAADHQSPSYVPTSALTPFAAVSKSTGYHLPELCGTVLSDRMPPPNRYGAPPDTARLDAVYDASELDGLGARDETAGLAAGTGNCPGL